MSNITETIKNLRKEAENVKNIIPIESSSGRIGMLFHYYRIVNPKTILKLLDCIEEIHNVLYVVRQTAKDQTTQQLIREIFQKYFGDR